VAVDGDGTVLGTAESGPNHGGPASHVASASFMVDPRHAGRGVGRAPPVTGYTGLHIMYRRL
jgi:hypothetical protein